MDEKKTFIKGYKKQSKMPGLAQLMRAEGRKLGSYAMGVVVHICPTVVSFLRVCSCLRKKNSLSGEDICSHPHTVNLISIF